MGVIMLRKILKYSIICFIFLNFVFFKVSFADDYNEGVYTSKTITVDNNLPKTKMPNVNAAAAIVVDMDSGRVLYEKNAYSRRAIASTTKIMTAIVAIENGNLDDIVTVSKRAANTSGSTIDLKEGEQLTLKDMLYGLMLNSGNDAAIAIAEHIGGSVEDFADMMNEKAKELGAKDTHFVTPHGLDTPGHYSTAYDMALITRYALTNPVFSSIVCTKSSSIKGRQLYNTNEMLSIYPGANGVKTGYTGQAGRCLVTSSTRDNWRIVSVVLGCSTRTQRAGSSQNMLDYAYKTYKTHDLIKENEKIKDIPVIKGIKKSVPILAVNSISFPLKQEEVNSIKREIFLPQSIHAPIKAGVEVGEIKYFLNGKVFASTALITGESIRRKGFLDYFGEILSTWGRLMRMESSETAMKNVE